MFIFSVFDTIKLLSNVSRIFIYKGEKGTGGLFPLFNLRSQVTFLNVVVGPRARGGQKDSVPFPITLLPPFTGPRGCDDKKVKVENFSWAGKLGGSSTRLCGLASWRGGACVAGGGAGTGLAPPAARTHARSIFIQGPPSVTRLDPMPAAPGTARSWWSPSRRRRCCTNTRASFARAEDSEVSAPTT